MVLNDTKKVIAIVGPTASGKSNLSMFLAKNMNRDIISCDSMQIYKYMDIGTAKPTKKDMMEIHHHMIDIVTPDVSYSSSDYSIESQNVYSSILSQNKNAIVCGGTGLYLDAFLGKIDYSSPSQNEEIRNKLYEEYEQNGIDSLYEKLKEIDYESSLVIHKNNTKRVIRALEIYYVTGKPKSLYDKEHFNSNKYDSIIIGLEYCDRDILRKKIDDRTEKMIKDGLIEETESLLKKGYLKEGTTAYQAIGYKEVIEYLNNKCSKDEMIQKIKFSTHRYAKRQLTWFKRNENIIWISLDNLSEDELKRKAIEIINERG